MRRGRRARTLDSAAAERGRATDTPPTVTAVLEDGPLMGKRLEAGAVEGRPPKTLDVDTGDGHTCRYVLSHWVQSGHTAKYSFMYRV